MYSKRGVNFYKTKKDVCYFLEIDKFLFMFLPPSGGSVTFINCSVLADMNKLVFEPVVNTIEKYNKNQKLD